MSNPEPEDQLDSDGIEHPDDAAWDAELDLMQED
jgi:hypothetical protein